MTHLEAHYGVYSMVGGLKLDLRFNLHSYFVYARSKESDETVHMCTSSESSLHTDVATTKIHIVLINNTQFLYGHWA